MKQYKYISLLLSIFFLLSCANNEKRNKISNNSFKINIFIDEKAELNDANRLSDAIEEYRFVPLESIKESLIGRIDKVRVFEDKIFVLERFTAKSLFVFSNSGQFLHKIGKSGNGPGEFIIPMDFAIDKERNEIIILDAERKKQLYFTLSGKFIKDSSIEFFANNLEYWNSEKFIYKGSGRENNLIITDDQGVRTRSYFPFKSRNVSTVIKNPIQIHNDTVALFRLFTKDTIFKIMDKTIVPHRIINFKGDDRSAKQKNKGTPVELENINYILADYIESDSHVGLAYDIKRPYNQYYNVFINKKTGNKIYLQRDEFTNDIFYDNDFLNIQTVTSKNEFVFILQPHLIMEAIKKKNIVLNENISFLKELEDTSNPVLMFAKLKYF